MGTAGAGVGGCLARWLSGVRPSSTCPGPTLTLCINCNH